jgi:hypothetical protein
MIKMYATPFMEWFRHQTDNETLEIKLIALNEFKEAFFKSSGKKIYFVNNLEITLSDVQVVTYDF